MTVEVELAEGELEELTAKEAFYQDVDATKTVIEVNLFYIRYISDISTIEQTFRIAVGIDMEWKATDRDLEDWSKGADAQKDYVPEVVPNFELPNAKEISIERRALENGNPFKLTESTGKNFLRAFIEATCLQQFNLRSFPFDVQDLVVNIDMSFALKDKLVFAPTPNEDASLVILNRQYSAIPEFDFSRTVVKFDCDNTWSRMELHVQMARQPEGPLYRVAFPCFLLTMVTITSFGFDLDLEFAERIAYLVTLVLTFVAFAFVSITLARFPCDLDLKKTHICIDHQSTAAGSSIFDFIGQVQYVVIYYGGGSSWNTLPA